MTDLSDDIDERSTLTQEMEQGRMSGPPDLLPSLPSGWTAEPLPDGSFRLIRTLWWRSPTPFSTEWRIGPNLVEERLGLQGRRLIRRFTQATMTVAPVVTNGFIAYWGLFINDREIDRTGRSTQRSDLHALGNFLSEITGWPRPTEP